MERLNEMFSIEPKSSYISLMKRWGKEGPMSVEKIIEKTNELNLPEIKLPLKGVFKDENEVYFMNEIVIGTKGQYIPGKGFCGFARCSTRYGIIEGWFMKGIP